ncbi:MAG: DUF72 domain-containing protein [Sphingobacteriales bacterium]|nr:MAG: DUF72 domain-containing protein [Sphingobacteriales bacterium]
MHMILTTPHAFIRFMGYKVQSDYTRIDAWIERIAKWRAAGLESLNFFVHTDDDRYAPVLVDYTIAQLNEKLGLNLKRPVFLEQSKSLLF